MKLQAIFLSIVVILSVGKPSAKTLSLAASNFATYVSDEGKSARLQILVDEAFKRMQRPVEFSVMSQAFLGSALLSQSADGEFAFIDLGNRSNRHIYSNTYLPLYLYAASKDKAVTHIQLASHLHDARVAAENRFANTPRFRQLKEIKWSRNPSSFDAFRQLADDRAPYIVTSRLLLDEFNLLLKKEGEELLYYSQAPIVKTGIRISLNQSVNGVSQTIDDFNATIEKMQRDGSFNEILSVLWLTKDIDGDGVAEYITSSKLHFHASDKAILKQAFPLDESLVSDKSKFVIDGEKIEDWQGLLNKLSEQNVPVSDGFRDSLLDPEIYARMMKTW